MLGLLISKWEDLSSKEEYSPLHDTLEAGITLLKKYYQWADDTDAYFIAHGKLSFMSHLAYFLIYFSVLNPILKLEYLKVTWDKINLDVGIEHFKSHIGISKIQDP
jgi:hypothetical protein